MKSLWNDKEAKKAKGDPLKLRVYTSRLLGANENLVMHGGGNTSVKSRVKNIFGDEEDVLFVKGSGWDLATIEAEGFAPVKMDTLLQLAQLQELSDVDMVKNQRMAMTNPAAPNPSVEAILHAIIPFAYVDHTHADAVVTVTNTPGGRKRIKEIYGDRVLVIPYVMPGFILAKKIYEMTKDLDWSTIDGMVLLNHGVFSFSDDARDSYEKMIMLVTKAEKYLKAKGAKTLKGKKGLIDPINQAKIRKRVSDIWGSPILAASDSSGDFAEYSRLKNIRKIADRGPITPDHVIRTKRSPVIIGNNIDKDLNAFVANYNSYFKKYNKGETQLDPAPRWAIVEGQGSLFFGPSMKHANIIRDIARHTQNAVYQAEQLKKWKPLEQGELFEMEYWSLEQAKLKKAGAAKRFQGKIALVTGAASGIGMACVEQLAADGAAVAALDLDSSVDDLFSSDSILSIRCDVTKNKDLEKAINRVVNTFGGLDLLVSNAGIFPKSTEISTMDEKLWDRSMEINLTSHQKIMQLCIPFMEHGLDPAIILMGSKNVPAPGPGASAYSVAKAGLTQLARVAALELGSKGIRVNVVHPNAVYDTAIWTDDVLKTRAKNYGLTVEEYKTNNVLGVEVTSKDVASLTADLLGPTFSKITGAQIPIDGGNDRVI